MRRGFTLLEALTVAAVLAVLAGLLYPVFVQARERSGQTACVESLRQAHLAIKLYQASYEGADGGTVAQMGLPSQPLLAALPKLQATAVCRRLPSERLPFARAYPYIYMASDGPPGWGGASIWAAYVARLGDRALLLTDLNHNSLSESLMSDDFVHTGIAVAYGGQAIVRRRPGNPDNTDWWEK